MENKSNKKKYSNNNDNTKKGKGKKLDKKGNVEKVEEIHANDRKKIILGTKVIDFLLSISTFISLILNVYAFTEIKNRFYLNDPIYFSLIDRNMSFSIIVIIVNVMVYLFATLEIVSAIKNKNDYRFMRIVFSLLSIFTTLIVVIAFGTLVVNFTK